MNVKEIFNKMVDTVIELGSIEKEVAQLKKQDKERYIEKREFPIFHLPSYLQRYNYLVALYGVKEEYLEGMSIALIDQVESMGINTFGISINNYVRSLYLRALANVGIENDELIKKTMLEIVLIHQKEGIKPIRREILTQQYVKNQQVAMKNRKK